MAISTPSRILIIAICTFTGLAAIVLFTEPNQTSPITKDIFWVLAGLAVWSSAALVFALTSLVLDKGSDTTIHGFGITHGKSLITSLRRGAEVTVIIATDLWLYRAGRDLIPLVLYPITVFAVLELGLIAVKTFKSKTTWGT